MANAAMVEESAEIIWEAKYFRRILLLERLGNLL